MNPGIDLGLPQLGQPLGTLATRPAAEIATSRFSVGCECLDRGMWQFDRALPHLARLGAKWARVQTGWGRCERSPGHYDFAWLDEIVDALRAVGIQPWFNVGYGNQLYLPDAPHETAVGWTPIFSAAARTGWARFAEALAAHFAGRVDTFEVWNEPDIKAFWTPLDPAPESYAELVALTAPALRRGQAAARVVAGAIAGAFSDHGLAYVNRLFECGLGDHLDIFSYHIYVATPERWYEERLPLLRAVVDRYRPGLPLWQGESGAPSQAQAGQALANYEWSELKQAKWDARRALLDCALGAPLSAFFHAADFEFYIVKNEVVPKTYYFGLIGGPDYQPKPAFYAAQTLCTLLAGELAVDPATPTLTATEAAPDEHRAHCFTTARGPLLAWWQAHDTMESFTPTTATLTAAPALREPVVVEPISQAVYRPEPAGDGSWRVPLVDWPLLMVERSAVELS